MNGRAWSRGLWGSGAHLDIGINSHAVTAHLRMLSYADIHVEITRGPAPTADITLSSHSQPRTVVHSRWDRRSQTLGPPDSAVSTTGVARLEDFPGTVAHWAGGQLLESSERCPHDIDDLPLSFAPATRVGGCSCLDTR